MSSSRHCPDRPRSPSAPANMPASGVLGAAALLWVAGASFAHPTAAAESSPASVAASHRVVSAPVERVAMLVPTAEISPDGTGSAVQPLTPTAATSGSSVTPASKRRPASNLDPEPAAPGALPPSPNFVAGNPSTYGAPRYGNSRTEVTLTPQASPANPNPSAPSIEPRFESITSPTSFDQTGKGSGNYLRNDGSTGPITRDSSSPLTSDSLARSTPSSGSTVGDTPTTGGIASSDSTGSTTGGTTGGAAAAPPPAAAAPPPAAPAAAPPAAAPAPAV